MFSCVACGSYRADPRNHVSASMRYAAAAHDAAARRPGEQRADRSWPHPAASLRPRSRALRWPEAGFRTAEPSRLQAFCKHRASAAMPPCAASCDAVSPISLDAGDVVTKVEDIDITCVVLTSDERGSRPAAPLRRLPPLRSGFRMSIGDWHLVRHERPCRSSAACLKARGR